MGRRQSLCGPAQRDAPSLQRQLEAREAPGNYELSFHASGLRESRARQPYEANNLSVNVSGLSLASKERLKGSDSVKVDWKAGSLRSPPYFWYHQHFNTGTTKARYFAMTEGDFPKRLGIPLQVEQIEADREDPRIRVRFEQELKKAQAAKMRAELHHHDDHDPHDHDHGGIMFAVQDWKRKRHRI